MIILEPQCIGFAHVKVNSVFILLYSKAFPNDRIDFFGETEHLKLVSEELSAHEINIRYFPISIPSVKRSYYAKLLLEFKNINKVFQKAKWSNSSVILLSITSPTLLAVKILGLIFGGGIYIIVHGILDTIINRPRGLIGKIFWFKYYFVKFNIIKNIKYLLVGKHIEENLIKLFPDIKKNIYSWEIFCAHRESDINSERGLDSHLLNGLVDFHKFNRVNLKSASDKIVFACAGVASRVKGSHYFFKMADYMVNNFNNNNVEFQYIGHFVDKGMDQYTNGNVKIVSKDIPLSEIAYKNSFINIDFLVLFYPVDSYKLSVSGILFDAVNYIKPIIAIKNDMLSYYFNKYGDFGWLCNDYEGVVNVVKNISSNIDAVEYQEFKNNILKMRNDFELSMDSQSNKLREIFVQDR